MVFVCYCGDSFICSTEGQKLPVRIGRVSGVAYPVQTDGHTSEQPGVSAGVKLCSLDTI